MGELHGSPGISSKKLTEFCRRECKVTIVGQSPCGVIPDVVDLEQSEFVIDVAILTRQPFTENKHTSLNVRSEWCKRFYRKTDDRSKLRLSFNPCANVASAAVCN